MPQLVMSAKANKVHSFFQHKIEQYGGDIFKTSLFGFPTAVFYSAQANRFLFSNENTLVHTHWPYSVTNLVSHSLPAKTGEKAKCMRKTLTKLLKPQALQKFVGRVDCVVKSHMKSFWICNEQVKAFPLIRRCLFSVACTLFFSIDDQMQQEELFPHFEDMLKGMLMQMPLNLPGTRFRKAITARNHLRQIIQTFIDERRGNDDREDLLSCLVGEGEEEKLTDDEIKDNMLILLLASQDTVAITLTFLLRYLALNPECYRQVLQEQAQILRAMEGRKELQWEDIQKMKYSWRAAQETLRLQPPAHGTWRQSITDFYYAGYMIPKGWKLIWTVHSTHRNPEHFEDPEKFDPSRFEGKGPAPYTFVPFGGGPRMCPATEFAAMVILVFIHNAVKCFDWDLVDADENITADPLPIPARGLPLNLRLH
ncbi:hypothetical protein SUGI_0495360 [Cryptomeria japonica]|uniref:cytochrome P450 716B1 n=1 Tax=Cryptomeria japonica TaxID=3369 RepID=UPI002408DA78|nr:cytochrome P450 716B1 [Cryptomeria japonica]GLJ25851.1 hypothetical protein SUGI_0495360 [Cryptomeria japonica]